MNLLTGKRESIDKERSLLTKVGRTTMISSLLLGLIMLVIGLSLYTIALLDTYITESFSLARSTSVIAERIADNEELSARVLEIYRGMSEEERNNQYSAEYRNKFTGIENEEEFKRLRSALKTMQKNSDVEYLYTGIYDPETQVLLYICDPDENSSTACGVGEWEKVTEKEVDAFMNWDGKGKLHDIGGTPHHGWLCTSGFPIDNDKGETVAFVLADITLSGVWRGIRLFLLQYAIALALVLLAISRFLNGELVKSIVEPINKIADAAQSYIRDRNAGLTVTDHFDDLTGIKTGDEIEHLIMIMADMEHNIAAYDDALCKAVAENERAHTEMTLAARIQQDMLPTQFPAFPDRDEFDLYGQMVPAKEIGGDFYDFFMIDQDHMGIVMADVSGKGIPAALFMMASMIIISNTAMNNPGYKPGEILEKANEAICMNNSEDMFVTVWLGILDIPSGVIHAANAGHEYPAVKHADSSFELLKDQHGFVLGTMTGMKYRDKEYEIRLEPGAKLFLYTDGVPEATDAGNELFGTDRMIDALNKNVNASPEEVLRNVKQAVDIFVGDASQFDDLTMLCLEYKGGSQRHPENELIRRPSVNAARRARKLSKSRLR